MVSYMRSLCKIVAVTCIWENPSDLTLCGPHKPPICVALFPPFYAFQTSSRLPLILEFFGHAIFELNLLFVSFHPIKHTIHAS